MQGDRYMIRRVVALAIGVPLILVGCSSFKNVTEVKGEREGIESDVNLDVRKFVFDNGLRLLVIENPKLPIYSYYTLFDVGGRYESRDDKTTGATHFLEHMMFKGAKKYGPGKFDSFIENNGGSTNAYTNFDSTVYYENMPAHTLETIIDMEADRMANLLLEPTPFESERQVVLEERRYRYENSPGGKLYLAMMQNIFEGTPYGGSVIGDASDVRNLTRDQMMEFFHKFYRPDNAIIVVAGDVDADDVVKLVSEKYGTLARSSQEVQDFKEKMNAPERFADRTRFKREVKLKAQNPNPQFMKAYAGEPIGTRRSFVMDILSSVLGDGASSYLNQRYVKSKNPMLSQVSAGNYTLQYNGVFYISGELLDGVSLTKFKRALARDTKNMCREAIDERSLQKTKNQYLVSYMSQIDTNAGMAHFVGLREKFYNDYSFYKKEMEIYQSITVEELQRTCEEVFKGDESIFLSVWNQHPEKSGR